MCCFISYTSYFNTVAVRCSFIFVTNGCVSRCSIDLYVSEWTKEKKSNMAKRRDPHTLYSLFVDIKFCSSYSLLKPRMDRKRKRKKKKSLVLTDANEYRFCSELSFEHLTYTHTYTHMPHLVIQCTEMDCQYER